MSRRRASSSPPNLRFPHSAAGHRFVPVELRAIRNMFVAEGVEGDVVAGAKHFDTGGNVFLSWDTGQDVRVAHYAQQAPAEAHDQRGSFVDSQADQVGMTLEHLLQSPEPVALEKMLIDDRVRHQSQAAG